MAEKDDSQASDQEQPKRDEDDNRTLEEIRESKIKYSDDDLKKAIDLIKKRGYITKLDFKKMDDTVWADGFYKAMDSKIQEDDSYNPYLYIELFDFKGGDIDAIIFDMDKVKTRDDALKTLAKTLHETIIR
ncbi:hypothetical protein [Acetilactobacillus jinshanensis]|uniref:hypothetical protein n=1 Tax=Acetilactobacillus jinshanensis TaxID=1720083 RepID=UPI001F2F2CE9|nr:hypothetical protein [Acetilactobacillus jinshanensis]